MDLLLILLGGLNGVALAYLLYSFYCTLRLFPSDRLDGRVPESILPPVSIIKPVAGIEEQTRENFLSFCTQDYPEYEIVFALADPKDPVLPLLEELRREFPARNIRWRIVHENRGPNYKVGNLVGAVREARYELLVFNDSDMRAAPDYLREVASAFLPEKVGLVTCLYRSVNLHTLPAALHALTLQTGFVPSVAVSRKTEGLSYAFGATICTSKEVLNCFGGLETLADYLADDYQMGYRTHRAGLRVELAPVLVDDVCGRLRFKDYLRHQLRWAVTQRVCRPGGYYASIVTHATSLSLLLLVATRFSLHALFYFLIVCGLRIVSSHWLNRRFFRNREIGRYFWLIPFNDLLNTLIWALSLLRNTVQWRQRRFYVLAGGRMVELGRTQAD